MAEVARARMVANGVAPEDIEVRIGNGIVSVVGGRRLGLAEVPLASMPDESILRACSGHSLAACRMPNP